MMTIVRAGVSRLDPAHRILRPARGTACALACAALLGACGKGESGPAGAPAGGPGGASAPIPAKVLTVAPRRVPILIETVGQVEGSKEIEVRARVTGILQKRLYSEGELVRADAQLFQIDPAPYEIALAQARAQQAQERARNEQARREAGRLEKLVAERAISQKEYDDASTGVKLSNAALAAAEANVRQAELNLSYTLVRAPVSGVTGRLARSEGSLVSAGQESSLLTTIVQLNPIWVRFSLSESDSAKLPGGKFRRQGSAEVRLTLPDGSPYSGRGRVNFAATQIDPRLATQQVRAEFDNPEAKLLPGQFVRVQLAAGERDNVFLVPQTAVMQTEKGHMVFIVGPDGKAAVRPVQAGDWIGQDWLILSGLQAGDRVVLDNLLKLRPGVPVAAVAPAEGKPPAGADAQKIPAGKNAAGK